MAEQNEDAKQIIDGILEDARAEAEKIKSEAKSRVEDRRALLSGRVQRIKDDAKSEAKRRIEEINRRTDAEISRAKRRNELSRRRDVLAAVEKRARARIVEMSRAAAEAAGGGAGAGGRGGRETGAGQGDRDYIGVLSGWIVEGALGLEGSEFTVAAAEGEEQLLEKALPAAREKAGELAGEEITLTAASGPHGGSPGIVVYAPDDRTLYDNRIDARLRRHESEIRRAVYEVMFPEDGDGGGNTVGEGDGGRDAAGEGDGG